MFYVTMIDTFLSNWGKAENKNARYVLECETLKEAKIVAKNAKNRTDMIKVSIVTTKPYYNEATDQCTYANKETAANWFVPDFFKK